MYSFPLPFFIWFTLLEHLLCCLAQPYEIMEAVVKCASLVAYLEGYHQLRLPGDAHDLSVSSLQKRIEALERAAVIIPPPPLEASSWNGLVWRAWQVRAKISLFPRQPAVDEVRQHAVMVEDDDCTLASLWRAVDSLDAGLAALQCPSCDGSESGAGSQQQQQQCLGAMVQKLAYIAGAQNRPFPDYPWTKALVYAYAADVAFEAAKRLQYTRMWNAPGRWPPAKPQGVGGAVGARKVSDNAASGNEETRRGRWKTSLAKGRSSDSHRRPQRSTWVNRLLFWRSGKMRADSDSSSSSSREVVD